MILLLGLLILGLSWLVPGHFVPWVSFQQEWVAAIGTTLIGFAALAPLRERRMFWPVPALFVLAVAVIPLLQLASGQILFVSDAVLAALYLAGLALAMVAGHALVQTRRTEFIGGLLGVCLAAGIVSTGLALRQWLQLDPIWYVADMMPGGRPFANLAQANHLATLQALAIVGALWLFETRRIGAHAAWAALAWLGFGIAMTQSRTGWLFVVALVISWAWVRQRTALRTSPAAVGTALILFVAALILWAPLSEAVHVSSQTFGQRLQPGPRMQLWTALVNGLEASPWFGYGWTQVAQATQAASLEHITGRGLLRNSHSLALDLLLWNGIPLGLVLIGALVWWFVRQVRLCDDLDRWLLLLAICAVFIHGLLEYPLEYAYFLLPTGMMMGALDGMSATHALRVPRAAVGGMLAVLTAMLVWIAVEYVEVEGAARQMRFVMAGIGVDKVPTAPPPDVKLLDAPREFHKLWLTRARPGMSPEELGWMGKVVTRNPVPPAQLRYALALGLNGHSLEASNTLHRLCFMHRPAMCKEGVESWRLLQEQYEVLRAIPFPQKAKQVFAVQK